jgi:hypothetical protein
MALAGSACAAGHDGFLRGSSAGELQRKSGRGYRLTFRSGAAGPRGKVHASDEDDVEIESAVDDRGMILHWLMRCSAWRLVESAENHRLVAAAFIAKQSR